MVSKLSCVSNSCFEILGWSFSFLLTSDTIVDRGFDPSFETVVVSILSSFNQQFEVTDLELLLVDVVVVVVSEIFHCAWCNISSSSLPSKTGEDDGSVSSGLISCASLVSVNMEWLLFVENS